MVCLGTLVAVIVLPLLALWLASPGTTAPFLDESGDELAGSIAESSELVLGGVSQFVLMRGKSTANPVLLLLHGGPGDPQAPLFHHYNRALDDHFIVVNWDQRGAGRSFHDSIPPETMTVEQLIADTHELTGYLMQRFSKTKIFLAGHSWGSYLGTKVVDRHPEDYWAYVGIGQVADQVRSETLSFRAVLSEARARGNAKAVEALEAVGPPEDGNYRGGIAGLGTERRWVREFGGAAHGKNNLESL